MTQRGPRALWLVVVVAVAGTSTSGTVVSAFGPPSQGPGQAAATDYCAMLGGDNIQGKKSGFLAGNKVYYVGGKYLVQQCAENETIGINHPMFHDLRSRGTGIASYKGVGTGNDFDGWEFHRATQVAAGSVVVAGYTWIRPAPTRMFWRPDKMVVDYELSSPFLQGVTPGWCSNWTQIPYPPGGSNSSFWVNLTEPQCWSHCDADSRCKQAVYESNAGGQCWTGSNVMTQEPAPSRGGCTPAPCHDYCYAKGTTVPNVTLHEEKFIAENDVVSTIVTSDRPVVLEISGRSFASADNAAGKVLSLHGQCTVDKAANSVRVVESGVVSAHVQNTPDGSPVFATGKLMYDGMSGVLTASRQMINATTYEIDPKTVGGVGTVCGYTFYVPVDSKGTTISWTMDDDYSKALAAVRQTQGDPAGQLAAKTAKMNGLLNNVVPYFRCSDDAVVKIYYYLWSLYLMYFTQGDKGMQVIPHTQTAVNNFLGMHRFDAMFQIMVGAWVSPARHDFYANGNVLAWSQLLPYRQQSQLPDNFGIDWASGCYGPETIVHVQGAWKIYEHSGNLTFLNLSYAFYKELFWDGGVGGTFGYEYDSVLCLNRMATILGHGNDTAHWNASINIDYVPTNLKNNWQKDTPNMYGSTVGTGMGWTNIAPAGMSVFPREWLVAMAETWMDDPTKGFNSKVPLTRTAQKDWGAHDPGNFAVVPDANWFMLRALYLHNVDRLANKFTLAHLKQYNMEWGGIPVAPEGRDSNFQLFGDQYSNFNAGKILLILEGIGGLRHSVDEDTFTFADNLPTNWTFMEFRVPVVKRHGAAVTWVKARAERKCQGGKVIKTVTVEGNPFQRLRVQPWAEGGTVVASSPSGGGLNQTAGHVDWTLTGGSTQVTVTLDAPCHPAV